MILPALRYERPGSLAEALELMHEPGARALAGGQSLINVLKLRLARVDLLVDISRLDELRTVEATPEGDLEIGAGVTYAELAADPVIGALHPRVADVAAGTVDQQVRCRGTLGGNCCYADAISNYPPLMVALGATMRIATSDGDRDVPAEEFFHGFSATAVERGELLRSVVLPPLSPRTGVGYSSLQLAEDSWSLARTVAVIHADDVVARARVVLGCVAPVPLRQPDVEASIEGREPTPEACAEAALVACDGVEPIADVHASSEYRREMAKVTTRRALVQALEDRVRRAEVA